MKKIIIFILLIMMFTISSHALTSSNEHLSTETKPLLTAEGKHFYNSFFDVGDLAELKKTELYTESMEGFDADKKAFITVYLGIMWKMGSVMHDMERLTDALKKSDEVFGTGFFAFDSTDDESVSRLHKYILPHAPDDTKISLREVSFSKLYVTDLLDAQDGKINILGKERDVTSVFCVDNERFFFGFATFFTTSDGVFVKFYNVYTPEIVADYTLQDFAEYVKADVAYRIENAPDEPIYGGNEGLASSGSEISGTVENAPTEIGKKAFLNWNNAVFIALAVTLSGVILYVAAHKVRKKSE